MSALTAAFLDRDGVINVKAPEGEYIKSWDEFEFLPGAPEAVAALANSGLRVVVVTNQRGIALGRMSEADLDDIHRRMVSELQAAGARVDAIYHCPHDMDECDCRKPKTGMFRRATEELPGVDLERSVVIGDADSDMEAGRRIGALRVQVGGDDAEADHHAPSLPDAVDWVLAR